MEFIKKLWEELVTAMKEFIATIIIIVTGINVIDDIDYNWKIKKSYWYAFITHPYRFIKYDGEEIKFKSLGG